MVSVGFVYMNSGPQLSMGVAYISAMLKKHGHKVTLWDTYYTTDKDIINQIVNSDAEIIMVSTNSLSFNHAVSITRGIKKERPDIPIFAGGWHTIVDPDEMINEPSIDLVCIGEGEYAALDVVNDIRNGLKNVSKIPNIWCKKNGNIIKNRPRPLSNIDDLPFPDRDIFNPLSLMDRDGKFFFSTERGCPYNCSYCCNRKMIELYSEVGSSYVRFRSVEKCMEELKQIKKRWNPKEIFFIDEMFLISEERVKDFCKAYIREKIGIPFGFMARVEKINDGIAKILKEAGCCRIHFGIECGNEEMRKKYLNRIMTNEQIINAFDVCKKFGIKTASFNMIGLPFETKETIRDTFEINKRCQPDSFQVTILYPFKGTKIYDTFKKNDMLDLTARMEETYYDSYITKNPNLSFSYLKHQQVFMELYFNYSKFFAHLSKIVPLGMLNFYMRGVSFIYKRNKLKTLISRMKKYLPKI